MTDDDARDLLQRMLEAAIGAADRVVVPDGETEGKDGRTGKDRTKAKQTQTFI